MRRTSRTCSRLLGSCLTIAGVQRGVGLQPPHHRGQALSQHRPYRYLNCRPYKRAARTRRQPARPGRVKRLSAPARTTRAPSLSQPRCTKDDTRRPGQVGRRAGPCPPRTISIASLTLPDVEGHQERSPSRRSGRPRRPGCSSAQPRRSSRSARPGRPHLPMSGRIRHLGADKHRPSCPLMSGTAGPRDHLFRMGVLSLLFNLPGWARLLWFLVAGLLAHVVMGGRVPVL